MGNILRYLEVMRAAVGVGLIALACTVGYIQYRHNGELPESSISGMSYLLELAGDASAGGNAALQKQVERAVRAGDLERARGLLGPVAERAGQSSRLARELRVSQTPVSANAAATRRSAGPGVAPGGTPAIRPGNGTAPAGAGDAPSTPASSSSDEPERHIAATVDLPSASRWSFQFPRLESCDEGDCAACAVPFPSVRQLSDAQQGPTAERSLESRLRCEYERAFGRGQGSDAERPTFEDWRRAVLERQYGSDWPIGSR